jgi:hypothetical protein
MVLIFLSPYIIINLNALEKLLALAKFTYNVTIYKVMQVTLLEADLSYISYLLIDFLRTSKPDDTTE